MLEDIDHGPPDDAGSGLLPVRDATGSVTSKVSSYTTTPPGNALGAPASVGKRIFARVIDLFLSSLVTMPFVMPVLAAQTPEEILELSGRAGLGSALALVLALVQVWLVGAKGWSIGKKVMGISVVDDATGATIGFGRAFGRELLVGLLSVLFLNLISIFLDSSGRRAAWQDKAVRTNVVDGMPQGSQRVARVSRTAATTSPGFAVPGQPVPPRLARPASSPAPAPAPASAPGASTLSAPTHGATAPGAPAFGPVPPAPHGGSPVPPPPPAPLPGYLGAPEADGYPQAAPTPGFPPAPAAATAPGYPGQTAPPAPPVPAGGYTGAPQVATGTPYSSAPAHQAAPHGTHVPGTPYHAAPDPAPGAGAAAPLITSVPGAGRASSSVPTHQVAPAFAPTHAAPAAPRHGGIELDEDLELTRLRPETPAAPAVDDGSIPASALLRISDGRELTITGTVLIGRNPAAGEDEEVGELVRVSDPGRSVSKTHVMIGVDADGVWAADRASTNGTVVTLADGQQIICAEHQVVRLPEGSSVTFGDYSVSFEFRGA